MVPLRLASSYRLLASCLRRIGPARPGSAAAPSPPSTRADRRTSYPERASRASPARARGPRTSQSCAGCDKGKNVTTCRPPPPPSSASKAGVSYAEGSRLPPDAPAWAAAASDRLRERREEGGLGSTAVPPDGVGRVLLHSCCAPCSGAMVEEMCSSDALDEVVVFFYNPNIHPRREYEIRKEENKRYCSKIGVKFVDCDCDPENWHERTGGTEYDPERGRRCAECFDMRMERTALYAHENGYDAIATTNATSRWKDAEQVDGSGYRAAARYDGLRYWSYDWQTDEMTLRKYQISANERFYKQEYCGCSYSLRDSNDWRIANGIPRIKIGGDTAGIGDRYFSDPIVDAAEESRDVVDEFFSQANEMADAGGEVGERKKRLAVYRDRRKNEANDGVIHGLNNW